MMKQNGSLILMALCYKFPVLADMQAGMALLHYPARKPGSLISAVPTKASGSVNLQGGD